MIAHQRVSHSANPSVIPVIEVNQSGETANQCPRQLKVMNKIMMVIKPNPITPVRLITRLIL